MVGAAFRDAAMVVMLLDDRSTTSKVCRECRYLGFLNLQVRLCEAKVE